MLLGCCKDERTELVHVCVGVPHLSVVEDHLVKYRAKNHTLILADP